MVIRVIYVVGRLREQLVAVEEGCRVLIYFCLLLLI